MGNSRRSKEREVGAYEAKTHLPRLLAEVEGGARITITRNGLPVAVLSQVEPATEAPSISRLIEELREARRGVRLRGLSIAALKATGRK